MKPQYILLILSPVIAEVVSGSTPFFTFLWPSVLLGYVGFYGLGALLIREVAAHKKLGYASIVLLGAAFGVLEEGILLKSWFDPTWMGAQITSEALRVYGVNVLQPFANVVYHAVISITAPILLVEATRSREPWLTEGQRRFAGILFVISALSLSTFNRDYNIEGWQYLMGFFICGLFTVVGLKGVKISPRTKMYTPRRIWVLGALFVFLMFFIFYTLGNARVSWVLVLGLALLLYLGYARTFSRVAWRPPHYFAAGAGVVTGLLPVVAVGVRTNPSRIMNVLCAMILAFILVARYKKCFSERKFL